MAARQFALGASGLPGADFGCYAYILKEKRGNAWKTLKTDSGRVPRCRSALHAVAIAVLFGLGECPEVSEDSHLLLAIDSEELSSILQGAEIPKRSRIEHLIVSKTVQKWREIRMRCEVKYIQKKSFEPRLLGEKLRRKMVEEEIQRWWQIYGNLTDEEIEAFEEEGRQRALDEQLWDELDEWDEYVEHPEH